MKLLLLGALVAVGILPARQEYTVVILDQRFQPDNIVIQMGQLVTWRNSDQEDHTVTANFRPPGQGDQDRPAFDSGILKPGTTFSFYFTRPGTYGYTCRLHPGMAGSVVVLNAP